jgi:large subunit ribosomal protein L29
MAKENTTQKENLNNLELNTLKSKISDEQLRLKKMHFAHAMTPLENPMLIRGLRKDIARLQTELSSRN